MNQTLEREKELFEKEFVKKATNWRENHGWTVDYVDSRADKLQDFLLSSHRRVMQELLGEIEAKYGKKGTFTGSLGYQGIVQGIKSFETETDRVRDEIINLIKQIYE